jgi:hypothetical protein
MAMKSRIPFLDIYQERESGFSHDRQIAGKTRRWRDGMQTT